MTLHVLNSYGTLVAIARLCRGVGETSPARFARREARKRGSC
jgi:hypothetical protein